MLKRWLILSVMLGASLGSFVYADDDDKREKKEKSDRGDKQQRKQAEKLQDQQRDRQRQEQKQLEKQQDKQREQQKQLEKQRDKQREEQKEQDKKRADKDDDKGRFDKRSQEWGKKGQKHRDEFREYRKKKHVFDRDYWDGYYGRRNHWRFNNSLNWWAVATFPAINSWLRYTNVEPRYYYYGDNGVVYYRDGRSYDNFVVLQNYNTFIQQAVLIARQIPEVDPQSIQWMPLGVFSLTQDSGVDYNPNDYFTLAISKEGLIGGVYYNPDTQQNEEIEGIVDSKSLRAVWKFIGKDWPIFETGVFNFTQDQSTAFVHYPDGRVDSQILIRLQE